MAMVFTQRVTWRRWALVVSETALVCGAVAFASRLDSPVGWQQLPKALLVVFLCQLGLYYAELYDARVAFAVDEHVIRLMQALGVVSLLLAAVYVMFPGLAFGRGVFVVASLLVLIGSLGWRRAFEWAARRVDDRERLLIVGATAGANALVREIADRTDLGVEIVGIIDPRPAHRSATARGEGGVLDTLPSLVLEHRVDRVVISLTESRGQLPMDRLLAVKAASGVRFDDLPSVYEEFTGKIAVEHLRPSWLLFARGFGRSRAFEWAKRSVDLVASAVGLVVLAPVMAAVAALVKLTSPGPVFYHQTRVGHQGRAFRVYKFRSMTDGAEASTGAVWTSAGDSRVTAIGGLLRRTRLDELPQLWNVVKGDMSLVGPRPERPEFVGELARHIPFYEQRHVVKPGITGWAQVNYHYGSSVADALEKLQFDLFYVKNRSLSLDVFILAKTVQTVLFQRGL